MYTDPVCDFLRALYVDFDFAAAHASLRQCRKVGFDPGWGILNRFSFSFSVFQVLLFSPEVGIQQ